MPNKQDPRVALWGAFCDITDRYALLKSARLRRASEEVALHTYLVYLSLGGRRIR